MPSLAEQIRPHFALELLEGPSGEPVSLATAKEHLREDGNGQDATINTLITAARQWGEKHTGLAFMTQSWRLSLDRFPLGEFRLPRPPLRDVIAVKYIDPDGELRTLDPSKYRVDKASVPGRIEPAWSEAWPSTREVSGAVVVEFAAGFGAAADVPGDILAALKLHVGHLYLNREAVVTGTIATRIPFAVDALYAPHRVMEVV